MASNAATSILECCLLMEIGREAASSVVTLGISSLIIIVLVIPRPGLGMEAEWALFSPVAETSDTDSDW